MHEKENNLRMRKGSWSPEEDDSLRTCIATYGEGEWHRVPLRAGLNRCRKSCRLRWLNYLKPDIKRGEFEEDEVDLIMRLHKLLGNRWSLIARRLPGRTSNDIKNYWNTHLKKLISSKEIITPKITKDNIIKPQPQRLSNKYFFGSDNQNDIQIGETSTNSPKFTGPQFADNKEKPWWEVLMDDDNDKHILGSDNQNDIQIGETSTHSPNFSLPQSINNNERMWREILRGDDNKDNENQDKEEIKESNNINIINKTSYEQDNVDFWDFLDTPEDLSM